MLLPGLWQQSAHLTVAITKVSLLSVPLPPFLHRQGLMAFAVRLKFLAHIFQLMNLYV